MVELLAPAGSPEALNAAVSEGADAVYLGLKSFNARLRSANFAFSQFEGAVRALHRMGRRVYVTVNTVFEQREAARVWQLLTYLAAVGPDAVIVQDFGVLAMAREIGGLRVHASTQMNIASTRGANALSARGVSRAVLARELSLDEIRAVRQGTNLELEVFVHGALCVSESGLCLFSSYLGGKSANRGMCTQACRRLYHTEEGGEVSPPLRTCGSSLPPLRGFYPRNAPAVTANNGYYFSPCDLSLIAHIPELADAGVTSFKIEGRMKSAEYVGAVVSAYRLVIDSLEGGEEQQRRALEDARRILKNDFARPKTEYFFLGGALGAAEGGWLLPGEAGGTGIPLGTILSVKRENGVTLGLVRCAVTPAIGDSARFHKADDSRRQTQKLTAVEAGGGASGAGTWYISLPSGFDTGDAAYLIQTRAMSKRYPPVIPKDLSAFRRAPGRERAPAPPFPVPVRGADKTAARSRRGGKSELPEGLYAAVASVEDLYALQSVRPQAAILPVNRKTTPRLLGNDAPLPFRPEELILALDPYFPQDAEAFYAETLPALTEAGYRAFILNNPGYFSFFGGRGKNGADRPLLIAGPWLYTFNGWSAAFVLGMGADYAVSPPENNRQNLEKTWDGKALRSRVFVNLFAWPPLFRVRADLGKVYAFRRFNGGGGQSERFSLVSAPEAAGGGPQGETVVLPETPFSIVDKRPFLETAGFRRFILDFSGGAFSAAFPLKKRLYKDVMKAAREGTPLAGTTRFNWKDGFFQVKETE